MLTQEQRDRLGVELTKLAVAYGVEFPKEKATIYINALIEYVPGNCEIYLKALKRYVADGNGFFPSPINLQKYINLGPEAEARETIDKIKMAIRDYGWADPTGAAHFMGPLAWTVVKGLGGWANLCSSDFIFNHGLIAQARNRAEDFARLGNFDKALPEIAAPMKCEAINYQSVEILEPEPAKILAIPPEHERKALIEKMMTDYKIKNML